MAWFFPNAAGKKVTVVEFEEFSFAYLIVVELQSSEELDSPDCKFKKRGRLWRHLKNFEWIGSTPNFIRCSLTTPSNFSLLYLLVILSNLADKRQSIREAATSKQPKTEPMMTKAWQSGIWESFRCGGTSDDDDLWPLTAMILGSSFTPPPEKSASV